MLFTIFTDMCVQKRENSSIFLSIDGRTDSKIDIKLEYQEVNQFLCPRENQSMMLRS